MSPERTAYEIILSLSKVPDWKVGFLLGFGLVYVDRVEDRIRLPRALTKREGQLSTKLLEK